MWKFLWLFQAQLQSRFFSLLICFLCWWCSSTRRPWNLCEMPPKFSKPIVTHFALFGPGTRKTVITILFFKEPTKWCLEHWCSRKHSLQAVYLEGILSPPLYSQPVYFAASLSCEGSRKTGTSRVCQGSAWCDTWCNWCSFPWKVRRSSNSYSPSERACLNSSKKQSEKVNKFLFLSLKYTLGFKHICVRQITRSDRGVNLSV